MVDLHAKLKPSQMEDPLVECLFLENSMISFHVEITIEISCNSKDPWFAYLENKRAKKPNILESALMGKVDLVGR